MSCHVDVAIKNTVERTLEVFIHLDRGGHAMAACAEYDFIRIRCRLPQNPETAEHREDVLDDDVQLHIRHGPELLNQQLSRNSRHQSKCLLSFDNTVNNASK